MPKSTKIVRRFKNPEKSNIKKKYIKKSQSLINTKSNEEIIVNEQNIINVMNLKDTTNSQEKTDNTVITNMSNDVDDSCDLFDSDMVEETVVDYDPMKNLKKKIPWVDKYRPKRLREIIYQEEVIKVLNECLKTGQLTHMLFYGPPGTGKTSSILSFVNELYGPNIINQRVIELNASDERGINIVRNKIIAFAKIAVGNPDPNYPSPPYKIIILDEADAMTTEAQSALRTIMETMSNITRFCFICNYINQIIDPIASRCMKFRFKSINDISMQEKLRSIAKSEKFDISENIMIKITELTKGDVRHGIMTLQYLKSIYDHKGKIEMTDVYQISNCLPTDEITQLWKSCILNNNSTVKIIMNNIIVLRQKGYSINAVIEQLKNITIRSKDMNDNQKSIICMMMSKIEKMLIDGSDEYLQLLLLLTHIHGVYKKIITIDTIETLKNETSM